MTEYLAPPLELNPAGLKAFFDEAMDAYFPGWQPGSGNLADRIAGAQSLIDAQLMEAASDGATNIFRYWGANIAGIPPNEAALATGTTTWVATDTLGHVIPAGTVAIWTNGLGNRVGFETGEPATIPAASTTVAGVAVRALLPGEEANNISGAATELSSPLAFIASVTMTSPSNGGSEAEEDGVYLSRVVGEAKLLSRKLITISDFNAALLSKSGVGRAYTIGSYNPTATAVESVKENGNKRLGNVPKSLAEKLLPGTLVTGTGIPANTYVVATEETAGLWYILINNTATTSETKSLTFTGLTKQPGQITTWLAKPNGEALGSGEIAALEAELAEQSLLSGVTWHGAQPLSTTINVRVIVVAWPGQKTATIKEAVEAAIRAYINPENWGQLPGTQVKEWHSDATVRLINVEHAALSVSGTHFVSGVELNSTNEDQFMPGAVPLPKLGTLTVEVSTG